MGESNLDSTQVEQTPAQTGEPGWKKAINIVAIVAIGVAGLFSLIFMGLVSYAYGTEANSKSYDLTELYKNMLEAMENAKSFEAFLSNVMCQFVVIMLKFAALIVVLVCFIKMLVQFIRLWSHKENNAERVSVTTVLLFISFAILVLLAATTTAYSYEDQAVKFTYSSSTKAGLIIVSIFFGIYICCKLALTVIDIIKAKSKNQIFNSSFALGAVIVAMVLLILLASSGVGITEDGYSTTNGYNFLTWYNLAVYIETEAKSSEYLVSYMCALVCFVLQFVLVFNTGKFFHASLRGALNGKEKVNMGSAIGLVVVSSIYAISSIVLTNQFPYYKDALDSGASMLLANTIMIVVMAILALAVAIVNKVLVKDEAEA